MLWCRDNMTKDYVLHVGRVSEVKLFITVINSREEAHEATVSIDMPPAFEYLGTDQRVCWSLSQSSVLCVWSHAVCWHRVQPPYGTLWMRPLQKLRAVGPITLGPPPTFMTGCNFFRCNCNRMERLKDLNSKCHLDVTGDLHFQQ